MRIVSWNVNGLRACARKGFLRFLEDSEADVVGIQEVRAFEHQLEPAVRAPLGWHATFSPAERAGYSGVAIYSREPPDRVETSLDEPRFDAEGRLAIARFGRLCCGVGLLPQGQRQRPRQPSRALQARLLRGALRTPAGAAAPRAGVRRRRLQHGARADRSRAARRQHEDQRLPAGGARGADALDRRGLGGHLPQLPPGRRGATTRGGGNGAAPARTTSDGASTTCWRRRPRRGG